MAVTPNIKTTNNYFERTETLVKYYHEANEYDISILVIWLRFCEFFAIASFLTVAKRFGK